MQELTKCKEKETSSQRTFFLLLSFSSALLALVAVLLVVRVLLSLSVIQQQSLLCVMYMIDINVVIHCISIIKRYYI
jgi:hypothetical protein